MNSVNTGIHFTELSAATTAIQPGTQMVQVKQSTEVVCVTIATSRLRPRRQVINMGIEDLEEGEREKTIRPKRRRG